jgi:hypothetical protein
MQNFLIRRSFLLPLGLLLILSLSLFVVVLAQGQPKAKAIILGVLILPVATLFAESLFRRVVLNDVSITVHKPLREKSLLFADLTAIDTVQVRKRVFLTLSTEEDFIILSNAYANFPQLVAELLTRVAPAVVSEETRVLAADVPVKSADIVSCWVATLLMALILCLQFA